MTETNFISITTQICYHSKNTLQSVFFTLIATSPCKQRGITNKVLKLTFSTNCVKLILLSFVCPNIRNGLFSVNIAPCFVIIQKIRKGSLQRHYIMITLNIAKCDEKHCDITLHSFLSIQVPAFFRDKPGF